MKITKQKLFLIAGVCIGSACVKYIHDINELHALNEELHNKNTTLQADIDKLNKKSTQPNEQNLKKIHQQVQDKYNQLSQITAAKKDIKIVYLHGNKPSNEVEFYFTMMSSIHLLTEKAKEFHVDIPKNYKFGFDTYVQKDTIPSKDTIYLLYKQSKIAAQILTALFESNDYGMQLISFQRESINTVYQSSKNKQPTQKSNNTTTNKNNSKQANNKRNNNSNNNSTKNKKSASIDTIGVLNNANNYIREHNINSYIFSLQFECYTSTFRRFFNALHHYKFPVIIRQLSVNTPSNNSHTLHTSKSTFTVTLEWLILKDMPIDKYTEPAKIKENK